MNEKEFNDLLKEKTEPVEIPDALKPENIPELLKDAEQKTYQQMWYRKPWIRVAAGVVLVGTAGVMLLTVRAGIKSAMNPKNSGTEEPTQGVVNTDAQQDNAGEAKTADSDDLTALSPIRTAKNQREIRNIFDDFADDYRYAWNEKDLVVEDAVAPDVEESNEMGASASANGTDYYETNAQVQNVAEADIVKTDGKYIYSAFEEDDYRLNAVKITSAKNGNLKEAGVIHQEDVIEAAGIGSDTNAPYLGIREMYIYDGKLILLCDVYHSENYKTHVITFDVSDPKHPTCIGSLAQDGTYSTSRLTDGSLYVFTNSFRDVYNTNFFKRRGYYIPEAGAEEIDLSDIYLPEKPDGPYYQVMTGVKLTDPDAYVSKKAILSESGVYYVSGENIYFAQKDYDGGRQTELMKFSYKDGVITPEGSVDFKGYLLNQFSMDEYDGVLRVAVSVDPDYNYVYEPGVVYEETSGAEVERPVSTNALYCIDENMNLIGEIKDLAPDERIYSVRFTGETGYFVTYRETDPLFSVDLSNPKNPKIMDALKIPGFSNYLHPYSDDLLFGLGEEIHPRTGEFLGLKLSMFDVSDPYDVTEADKTVLENAYYSPTQYNHKALLIAPDKNLIGFYSYGYDRDTYETEDYYYIYSYDDDYGFIKECTIDMDKLSVFNEYGNFYSSNQCVRCIYIDDCIYIVYLDHVVSYDMDTFEEIDEI